MSWLFSRALVEASSEDTCLVSALSMPSNENPTLPLYLPPDKMTDFSRLSRFGMTFAPKDHSIDRIDHAVMASDGCPLNPNWAEWLLEHSPSSQIAANDNYEDDWDSW